MDEPIPSGPGPDANALDLSRRGFVQRLVGGTSVTLTGGVSQVTRLLAGAALGPLVATAHAQGPVNTVIANGDTTLDESDPSSNFGFDPILLVEATSAQKRDILLTFDPTEISPFLPAATATLRVEVVMDTLPGGDTITLQACATSETEGTATWNNTAAGAGTAVVGAYEPASNVYAFDVTALVNASVAVFRLTRTTTSPDGGLSVMPRDQIAVMVPPQLQISTAPASSASPTPTTSATPTPTPTTSATPTPSPTASATPTPSPTATTTPTPSPTASPTPTPSSTPAPTPSATTTSTPSPTPTPTPTPTPSVPPPSASPTPTASATATPTPTPTATPTPTPSSSPFPTPTPSASPVPTPTPSASPAPTPTPSAAPGRAPGAPLLLSYEVLASPAAGPAAVMAGVPSLARTATSHDFLVRVSWLPPSTGGRPVDYVLEAGSVLGGRDYVAGQVLPGDATTLETRAPEGTYYVRVRARNEFGEGPASSELLVVLGDGPCTTAPSAPGALSGVATDLRMNLAWGAAAGAGRPTGSNSASRRAAPNSAPATSAASPASSPPGLPGCTTCACGG
ncbi:MAG: DNRLRE domain-containing protein [Vicinamibacterales bacterium]